MGCGLKEKGFTAELSRRSTRPEKRAGLKNKKIQLAAYCCQWIFRN
jgi:hypothetical protein